MPLPEANVKWFVGTQARWFEDHGIPEWFHGVITRKEAENLLQDTAPGCFLVRVSESRLGYTLSYSANNRCRHFMINVLDDGQFLIPGDEKKHKTLEDLVNFHLLNPIQTYNEQLVQPCQQNNTSLSNYKGLFPHDKIPLKRTTDWPAAPHNATNSSNKPVLNPPLPGNVSSKPPIPQPRRRSELPTPPVPLPRNVLGDQISDKTHELPSPLQAGDRRQLYPSITAEMRALSISNDATSIMPKLYPWKNNMKKSKSVDCLDLLDTKLEIIPEMTAVSRRVQFVETTGPVDKVSAKSDHVSNVGSSNVGKKLKKYILMNKAISAMADGKMVLTKSKEGASRENAAVHTHSGRLLNAGSNSPSGNVTTSRKLSELGNSAALFRNIVPPTANKLRSGTEMVTPCRRRQVKHLQEEYRQPPPFAPGF
ncbi:hematopoietic SH2 domain-containing protein [Microcaecilia unicolor]|uniref:Hematopoietic SH2 domain-containing protein n=1 Tax=Microcaecilia unicolor TaxID=1415580 RepID=A0A6P7ZJ43_9AMPH|nr:hematopoietic SH2 domain-containing protein [Microcaecilia unicolor]XP_030075911.1 hematopoietic SH2 domain-containing protein [Microcaecilia unicolor]